MVDGSVSSLQRIVLIRTEYLHIFLLSESVLAAVHLPHAMIKPDTVSASVAEQGRIP